ncbi:VAMP-associated protein [Cystobasidium minutum MCA 4210]|uniref:VAMP-associated protein n=1 Tax=Cystobasidium minutum MCA 4210 TaxID=1397322 RepID=UPI0034CF3BC2|eukprot:jgi/Rhomi1/160048/estExt_Genewise1Plus.C_3_t30393
MSVELDPNTQLAFHRPLTQLVKRTLTVTNSNSQPVAFKVKTTAPKQYCVRPNSGRIEPNERVEVQVLLQPMKEEPPAGTKCKDKFLVQSAIITPDRETKTLAELWATVEADVKSGKEGVIHEQKIRCAYLPPVSEGGADQTFNTSVTDGADASTVTATPSASGFLNGNTPSRFEDSRTAPSSVISKQPETRSINGSSDSGLPVQDTDAAATTTVEKVKAAVPTNIEEAKVAASNAASAVGAAATGAAASLGLSNASSGNSTALQRELDEAKAEIKRLKDLLSSKDGEGLRQRNVGSSSATSTSSAGAPGAATATVSQDGIPLPMVGALCAGVFVFTWLFL